MSRTAYLKAGLVYLQANLEAKLREVTAIQASIDSSGEDADGLLVERAASHLDSVKRLHNVGCALLCALDVALADAGIHQQRDQNAH